MKGTMKIQQQIAILDKKLAQARKNLKLFNSGESNTLAGRNLNPLVEKLESEISAYQSTIKELKAAQLKSRAR
jgi:flagellar biosynthesis chaperone FliJ